MLAQMSRHLSENGKKAAAARQPFKEEAAASLKSRNSLIHECLASGKWCRKNQLHFNLSEVMAS